MLSLLSNTTSWPSVFYNISQHLLEHYHTARLQRNIYYAIAAIGVRATLVLSLVIPATVILLPHKRRSLGSKQSDRLQGLAN